MRKIGLLAMVLLLGTGAMAQSAKLKGSGTSQSNAEVKGAKTELKTAGTGTFDVVQQDKIGIDRETANGISKAKQKANAKANLEQRLDELGEVADVEKNTDATSQGDAAVSNHGTAVSAVAKSTVDAGAKGALVSEVASVNGQLHAINKTIPQVSTGAQLKTGAQVNTRVGVGAVKVKTNTKVRTGVSIH